jgi:hypothetical protein
MVEVRVRDAVIGDLAAVVSMLAANVLGSARERAASPLDAGYLDAFAAITASPHVLRRPLGIALARQGLRRLHRPRKIGHDGHRPDRRLVTHAFVTKAGNWRLLLASKASRIQDL